MVGLAHLRGAVDEGVTHCHLAAGALQGNGDRLLRRLKKRAVELQDGHELRVQAGLVFDLKLDTVLIHDKSPPKIFGSPSFWLLRFPSFGDIMRSRKCGLEPRRPIEGGDIPTLLYNCIMQGVDCHLKCGKNFSQIISLKKLSWSAMMELQIWIVVEKSKKQRLLPS